MAAPAAGLAAYTSLALLLFERTWHDPTHLVAGLGGDANDFVWFLQWSAFAVSHHLNPLVSTYINYPGGVNLMWNTSIILPGILLAPITLTAGPVLSYAVLITVAPALSAMTAMVAFRRFTDHAGAAFAGGLLYGFSPPIVIQSLGHPQVTLAFFPPLVLIALDELLVRQRRSPILVGALLGVLTAVQILTGEEILASTALVAGIATVILVVLHRRQVVGHARHAIVGLAAAGVVASVLAAYPLWLQFFGPQRIHGIIHPRNVFVSDLLNFIVPTGFQAIAPAGLQPIVAQFTGVGVEYNAYLGIPLILLLAVAMWRFWRVPAVRFAVLTALVLAVLSLGPHLHIGGRDTGLRLPFVVIDRLPVFGNILPARLSLYITLLAGMVLAVALDRSLGVRSVWLRSGAAALVLTTLIPLVPAFSFPAVAAVSPTFFTSAAVQRIQQNEVVLVAPFARWPESAAPMLWQALAGMRYRMPEGYVAGPGPDGTAQFGPPASPMSLAMEDIGLYGNRPQMTDDRRAAIRKDLQDHRVTQVVVGPMPHQELMVALFTDLLGRPPEQVDGVLVWWIVGG
jgi:hypothetical protein